LIKRPFNKNFLFIFGLQKWKFIKSGVCMVFLSILYIIAIFTLTACHQAGDVSQWRGPDRNGIYPDKGLLKTWPSGGPRLLWSYEGLGAGHGNAGFSADKLFVLGMPDSTGVLYSFDLSGKLLWKKTYGPEWHINYGGPRSTPTIVGDLVYFESGMGVVYCYDANSGEKRWSVDLLDKFDAKNIEWGKAESLLIDGNRIFCTPGGVKNNVVALDRLTGETIWTSPGNSQPAAYGSPILVKSKKGSIIVTLTSESIVGIDAETGHLNWQVPQLMEYKNNPNTPVYSEGRIYCVGDQEKPNSGLVSLKLSDDGKNVSVDWRDEEFTSFMGGIIVKDGYILGSKYGKKAWYCIDAKTGKIQYISKILSHGAVIFAGERYYCYGEDGVMSLVEANPTSFNLVSSFKVSIGTDQHWAHPVIHNGGLCIRHGNAIMVYNIKDGN
jgi:outer membrane protein assembly factor BamB